MTMKKLLIVFGLPLLVLAACHKNIDKTDRTAEKFKGMTLQQKADYLINSNNEDQDPSNDFDERLYQDVVSQLQSKNDDGSKQLLAQLYLKHGVWVIYSGPSSATGDMHAAITQSLKDFINVLDIDPQNAQARAEINQILQIYKTMPDKSPDPSLVPKLRQLGFDV